MNKRADRSEIELLEGFVWSFCASEDSDHSNCLMYKDLLLIVADIKRRTQIETMNLCAEIATKAAPKKPKTLLDDCKVKAAHIINQKILRAVARIAPAAWNTHKSEEK